MTITVLDCETTTSNKGNPFDTTNKLCAVGVSQAGVGRALRIEHGDEPYGDTLNILKICLDHTSTLVLFNGKFDLNWITKYGVSLRAGMKVWDTQFFEFLASYQTWIMPDLETSCQKRGIITPKEKEVEQYWEAGIDTPQIPWELVEKRVLGDIELTRQLYQKQHEIYLTWSTARRNLFNLHCADLMVLQEIEFNGLKYDEEKSKAESTTTRARLRSIKQEIDQLSGDSRLNLNSPQHLSALLYGGKLVHKTKEIIGTYKTGGKTGQDRQGWREKEVVYPRLVEPLERTKAKTDGFWSVDKKVLGTLLLRRISAKVQKLIHLFIEHSKVERSLSAYTDGLPQLIQKMHWPPNTLHGTIHQVTAVTGRTSSSKPNLQNFDGELKHLFYSRYG